MTKTQRKRRSEIIRQLSELSRDGWARARYEDYSPLEKELEQLTCTS